jgi:small subunit ribosomal protein S5
MQDKPTQQNTETKQATAPVAPAVTRPGSKVFLGRKMRNATDPARRGGRSDGANPRGRSKDGQPRERVKPEFDSKIIDIRRVTRVASGGRRYSFSVAVVAGDKKGRVGVGLGKGIDTALAVEKATREAKKHLIKIPLTPQMTIPHAVEGKYASSRIVVFPAKGRGVVAGSSARVVIELAGIKDVCAKYMSGSKNKINNARVAIEALSRLVSVPRSSLNSTQK